MDLSPCCWRTRIGLSVPKALRSDAIAPLGTEARSSANVIFDRARRKVTELEKYLLVELLLDLLDDRVVLAAVRALVVAVFYQRHAGFALAFDVLRQRAGLARTGRFVAAQGENTNEDQDNDNDHSPELL